MNSLNNEQKNVSMRKLSLDEMAEINGGATSPEALLCRYGTSAGAGLIGGAIGAASAGWGIVIGMGLRYLGHWMCDTYTD